MKIAVNKPALLIILLIIFIVGMVLFILSKNPNFSLSNSLGRAPKPTIFIKIPKPNEDTSSWKTFSDPKLKFSLKYPSTVIFDPTQTVNGRLYAFIFAVDVNKAQTNKVPTLFIADTHSVNLDGFTAFKNSDCGGNCKASAADMIWVNINNVYGIKNPLSNDIDNYYLTDKKQIGDVINVYVGNDTNKNDKTIQNKINLFDQMIKTVQFER